MGVPKSDSRVASRPSIILSDARERRCNRGEFAFTSVAVRQDRASRSAPYGCDRQSQLHQADGSMRTAVLSHQGNKGHLQQASQGAGPNSFGRPTAVSHHARVPQLRACARSRFLSNLVHFDQEARDDPRTKTHSVRRPSSLVLIWATEGAHRMHRLSGGQP